MIISFEGPDMVGKSTQAKILQENFDKVGLKSKLIHFPRYDTPIGKLIKSILNGEEKLDMKSLQMLYIADQMNFKEELDKYINEGYIVILDRYDLSTLAYVSSCDNPNSQALVKEFRKFQVFIKKPNVTFIFDNGNRTCLFDNGKEKDLFEKDDTITRKINKSYINLVNEIHDRSIYVIDASKSIDEISKDILSYLFKNKRK